MHVDPFRAVRAFEADLCRYTGAPYAVAVNSCTMALLLSCAWLGDPYAPQDPRPRITIPKHTYVGVPMAIRLAGWSVDFEDLCWSGLYRLKPLPVWDAARRFTAGFFEWVDKGEVHRGRDEIFVCTSFHVSKILGHSQGGAILHNSPEADVWLRRARFDGRTEGVPPAEDTFDMLGWHAYMSPDVATALQWKLSTLPDQNYDLPNSNYPDLSTAPIFRS